MKIHPVGAKLLHEDIWMDGQTWQSQQFLFKILLMCLKIKYIARV